MKTFGKVVVLVAQGAFAAFLWMGIYDFWKNEIKGAFKRVSVKGKKFGRRLSAVR